MDLLPRAIKRDKELRCYFTQILTWSVLTNLVLVVIYISCGLLFYLVLTLREYMVRLGTLD